MEQAMPLILDIGLLAAVFLIVFFAARKGFVAAMVDLVGYIVSLVVSWIAAGKAAQWCFDTLLRERLLKSAASVFSAVAVWSIFSSILRWENFRKAGRDG